MGLYGLDRSGSGYGSVEGSCEHGNEPSVSLKCWEEKDTDLNKWTKPLVRCNKNFTKFKENFNRFYLI
jgi:hypothetical protein